MSIDPADDAALPHTPAAMVHGRFDSGTRHCGTVRSNDENSGDDYDRNLDQNTTMTQRYQTDDGELEWDRTKDMLYDVSDGYLDTIEGIDHKRGSSSGGLFRPLGDQDDDLDVEPNVLGSRLLTVLIQLHTLSLKHTVEGKPEEDVLYRMSKFAPVASKLSDQYAMEDKMYREQWHDDVLAICEAIMDTGRK